MAISASDTLTPLAEALRSRRHWTVRPVRVVVLAIKERIDQGAYLSQALDREPRRGDKLVGVREAKVASEPEALITFLRGLNLPLVRIGLEAGPLSNAAHEPPQPACWPRQTAVHTQTRT